MDKELYLQNQLSEVDKIEVTLTGVAPNVVCLVAKGLPSGLYDVYITRQINEPTATKPRRKPRTHLTREQRNECRVLYNKGMSVEDIANKFGCSMSRCQEYAKNGADNYRRDGKNPKGKSPS